MFAWQRLLPIALLVALVSGCGGVEPRDYQGTEPRFEIEEFFAGKTKAWGIFQGRSGEVKRRFEVTIDGYRDGEVFVLDERFQYADGETDQRVWRIRRTGEHTYRGRADDIIGVATGEQYGNALNWRYQLRLDVEGSTYDLTFNDWMYQINDRVMVNRATVTKFGFEVGEVTLFFQRQGDRS
jgi:hypothetical protein